MFKLLLEVFQKARDMELISRRGWNHTVFCSSSILTSYHHRVEKDRQIDKHNPNSMTQ